MVERRENKELMTTGIPYATDFRTIRGAKHVTHEHEARAGRPDNDPGTCRVQQSERPIVLQCGHGQSLRQLAPRNPHGSGRIGHQFLQNLSRR